MSGDVQREERQSTLRSRVMNCGTVRALEGSIEEQVDGFTRRLYFEPGYDCMAEHGDAVGRKCHGRGGMRLRFLLIGPDGATQFLFLASDWLPGSLNSIGSTRDDLPKVGVHASDLGHHWLTPTYEGEYVHGECEYLSDRPCFYDGSGLNAGPVLDRFLRWGIDAVWEELTDYYHHLVAEADATKREWDDSVPESATVYFGRQLQDGGS